MKKSKASLLNLIVALSLLLAAWPVGAVAAPPTKTVAAPTTQRSPDVIYVYNSTDVPQGFVDYGYVYSDIDVPEIAEVLDANVTISATHTYDGDLEIYLISPQGTEVELSTDNGGSGDNYTDTTFDDEALTPITDGSAPFTGDYQPEGMLSDVDGEDAFGTWTLRIYDDAGGDTGSLLAWSLTLDLLFPPLILDPPSQYEAGCQNSDVVYDLTLTNQSGTDDTFDITFEGNAWTSVAGPTSLYLTDGLSDTLAVTVTIPSYAFDGESDWLTVRATAQSSATLSTTASIETIAGSVWLPAEDGGSSALWPAYANDGASLYYVDGLDEYGDASDMLQIFTPGSGWSAGANHGWGDFYGGVAGYDAGSGMIYYAPGFEDGMTAVDDFYAYDPATDVWTDTLALRPEALGLGAGGVTDNGVFVWAGGSPDGAFLGYTPVYTYDIASDTWSTGATLSAVGFTAPGYVVVGDQLYVGGNYFGSDAFYVYDVGDDAWTQLADLPAGAGKISPLLIYDGSDIYLVGGGDSPAAATYTTWRYDVVGDEWHEFAYLFSSVQGNGGGYLGGLLYTFGGGYTTNEAYGGYTPHEYTLPQCPALTTYQLTGQVTNGVSGDPIEGAMLQAVATGPVALKASTTPVVWTDASGNYTMTLAPANYDITASYGTFDDMTESIALTGNATQDFVLGPPVASPSPTAYSVTLEWGETSTEILTLDNDGYSALSFEFIESNGGGPAVAAQGRDEPEIKIYPAGQENLNADVVLSLQPASGRTIAAPRVILADLEFVLDDGSAENNLGVNTGTAATQFIWLNRFTPDPGDFPFTLNQIQVFFDATPNSGVNPGDAIDLVVYEDADGDPSNGATWLATFNVTAQAADGVNWSVYDLASPVVFDGSGDVLIAAISRFVVSGVTPPLYPAAVDETSSQGRSWAGWWTGDPPDPAILPPDDTFGIIDGFGFPGNFLIRGYASFGIGGGEIPWLGEDPVTGTLPYQDDTSVDLTFDAYAVDELGTYTGTLMLKSNDPVSPSIPMPVALTVVENPDAGMIQGTVTSDRPGGALEGATVLLETATGFTATLTTDEDGYYEQKIHPDDLGTFTVTVSMLNYLDDVDTVVVGPPGSLQITHDVELVYAGPEIVVNPLFFEQTLTWGNTMTDYLTITNTGVADLNFDIFPAPVFYEDFEGDFAPQGWTVVNNSGAGWKRNDEYGAPNRTAPFGSGYCAAADADASGAGMDTELWSPSLAIPIGGRLEYASNFQDYGGNGDAYLDISTDGGTSWTNLTWWTNDYGPSYETVDLSAYGGQTVILRWHFVTPSWDWYWHVDDVGIFPDSSWLSWEPVSGTVASNTSQAITITKDSALVPGPGDYVAGVLVEHDDTLNDNVTVPITMHVNPHPDQGHLSGTVLGNRTSDGMDMPLQGASVQANSVSYTLSALTDQDGFYEFYFLPWMTGTYTVTISYSGYYSDEATVWIVPPSSLEVTHDVTLELIGPYLNADPESIAETLAWGGSAMHTLTISNPLPANQSLAVDIVELSGSYTPPIVQTVTVHVPATSVPDGAARSQARLPQTVQARPARDIQVVINSLALGQIKVLILTPDANPAVLMNTLQAYPDLDVTLWDALEGVPSVDDLLAYHVVIIGNDHLWSFDKEDTGDALADYIDAGGKVIEALYVQSFDAWGFGGRYMDDGYSPFTMATLDMWGYGELGIYNAGHPLMANVTTMTDDWGHQDPGLAAGAEAVAYWGDSEYYIATNGNVVAFNQLLHEAASWTGDVPTLLHNAILYLIPGDVPWLDESVTSFGLNVGQQATSNVTLDASVVDQPGTYQAWLWLEHNDPLQAGAYIPVEMNVQIDPTMGKLTGQVTMNRAKVGLDWPAMDATVVLSSTEGVHELTTNASGQYVYFYQAADLPLDVTATASYAGYQDDAATVTLNSGETVTADLQVELLAPWLDVTPTAFDVTVYADERLTTALTVDNLGLLDLNVPWIMEIAPQAPLVGLSGGETNVVWVDTPFTVDAEVSAELQQADKADFFIWLRERADLSPAYDTVDLDLRRQFVYHALTSVAARSQASVIAYLESRGLKYESFWINNSILVHGGDQALIDAMRLRGDVARIRGNYVQMSIPDPEQLAIVTLNDVNADPVWNIEIVNAPQVWSQLDVTGKGIVVANIDTGVRYTHEALVGSYRGNLGDDTFDHNYNWLAPSADAQNPAQCGTEFDSTVEPCDSDGHGTHTMGTMVGGDGDGPLDMDVGMAPDAQWMACMGCDGYYPGGPGGCSDEALIACAEWMVAPTDLNDENPDPTQAPDVVNNSWGGGGEDDWYYSYMEAWNAANIIPVFAAGNTGPACDTLDSPGNYDNVIQVGGTDNADYNYVYASRGPGSGTSVFPVQKPDIAAPGEGVPSAVATGDSDYASYSGTSMATPHVAGMTALLRSVNPVLDRTSILDLLISNAVTETLDIKNGDWCGAGPAFPNYVFGYGRIDAFATTLDLLSEQDIPWLSVTPVSGTVAPVPIIGLNAYTGTMPVDMIFDATGLEPGVYTGTLRVLHDDPLIGQVNIPLTMTVLAQPLTFEVTKTAAPEEFVMPGDIVTYTVTVANNGRIPFPIEVSDPIPEGTDYVDGSITGDPGFRDPPAAIEFSGVLANDDVLSFSFAVRVGEALTWGSVITNTVTVLVEDQEFTATSLVTVGMHTIYMPIILLNYQP